MSSRQATDHSDLIPGSSATHVDELASGEISIWVDPGGAICIKLNNKFHDPVELAEHEALEIADLLKKLVSDSKGGVV